MSGDHVQPTLGLCMSFKNCSQLIRSLWLTSAKDSRQTPVEMGEVAALDMGSAKTSKRSFWFVWRLGTPKTCCLMFNFPIKIAYLGTVPPAFSDIPVAIDNFILHYTSGKQFFGGAHTCWVRRGQCECWLLQEWHCPGSKSRTKQIYSYRYIYIWYVCIIIYTVINPKLVGSAVHYATMTHRIPNGSRFPF